MAAAGRWSLDSLRCRYKLITAHGRIDMLMFFADVNGDYEMVITFHIQRHATVCTSVPGMLACIHAYVYAGRTTL